MKKFIVYNPDGVCSTIVIALISVVLYCTEFITRAAGITAAILEADYMLQLLLLLWVCLWFCITTALWAVMADKFLHMREQLEDQTNSNK